METCCYELQRSSESQYPEHRLVHFTTNQEQPRSKASNFGGIKLQKFSKQYTYLVGGIPFAGTSEAARTASRYCKPKGFQSKDYQKTHRKQTNEEEY